MYMKIWLFIWQRTSNFNFFFVFISLGRKISMFKFIQKKIMSSGVQHAGTVQTATSEIYKQSLADLKKFTAQEMPEMRKSCETAMKMLEQNANTMTALKKIK